MFTFYGENIKSETSQVASGIGIGIQVEVELEWNVGIHKLQWRSWTSQVRLEKGIGKLLQVRRRKKVKGSSRKIG